MYLPANFRLLLLVYQVSPIYFFRYRKTLWIFFSAFNCYGCSSDTSPTPEGTQTCIDSPQDIPDTQGRIIQCLPFDNDTVVDIWEWKCYTAHILEKSVNSKFYSNFKYMVSNLCHIFVSVNRHKIYSWMLLNHIYWSILQARLERWCNVRYWSWYSQ